MVITDTCGPFEDKVTLVFFDEAWRRQRGAASEARLLHAAGSDEAEDRHGSVEAVTHQGGEQLRIMLLKFKGHSNTHNVSSISIRANQPGTILTRTVTPTVGPEYSISSSKAFCSSGFFSSLRIFAAGALAADNR